VRTAVSDHPDLAGIRVVDETDDFVLYRIGWGSELDGILDCIVQTNVSLSAGRVRKASGCSRDEPRPREPNRD